MARLMGVMAVALSGCQKPVPPAPPPPPASFFVARTESVPLTIKTFGNCVSVANVTLQAQVTGNLTRYAAAQGARVKAGDLIAEIDPSPFQAAVVEAQGSLDSARATLANSQVNLVRQQQLFKTKTNDLADLQNAEASQLQAQGQVQTAEGQLADAQINLQFCTIKTPVDGVVGIYNVDAGNLVTANSTKLVNIQTIDPIYVDFTISENQFDTVRQYLASGELRVEAQIPGAPEKVIAGKLAVINNQIESSTGTLMLRATFANADSVLWPGLFVNIKLVLATLDNAVIIPSQCILVGQNGPYVITVAPDNTVNRVQITLGQRESDMTVVTQGVQAGDHVITAGQLGLNSGMKVTPSPWEQPAEPSASPVAR